MKRLITAFMSFCLCSALALAAETVINDGAPERYTVQQGDTLWGISAMFLRDPWLWPEVWAANPQIDNPHLIYPGDVVSLVYVDGKPQLRLDRGGAGGSARQVESGGRTVRLSPQVKVTEHEAAISSIPLKAVNSFLARTRVVQPGELEAASYVVAGSDQRILSGERDTFYTRGTLPDDVDFFGIFRHDDAYVDLESGEILGIKAQDVGSAQLQHVDGEVATFLATRSTQEIMPGDRMLPHEERRLQPVFHPKAPAEQIRGAIIDVEGGVNQVGTLDVVAINRGDRENLAVGDILAIYKKGETVRDRVAGDMVTLPAERSGLMMVFRTFEKMSFALVMTASKPLEVGDEVRSP